MMNMRSKLVAVFGCLLMGCLLVEGLMKPRIEGSQKPKYDVYSGENDIEQSSIEERILIGEPFKGLLQTGIRFMLAQTKLMNHVNMDTAMDLINNLAYMLSKPSIVIKAIGAAAVSVLGLLVATFVSPGFYRFLESAWTDPINTLNLDRYLSNGLSERSVLGILGSTTDEALSRVGLQDGTCREKSLCYIGEIFKCTFPGTSNWASKVASEYFSSSSINESKYFRAFTSGFVDRNCTKVASSSSDADPKSCFGSFISSILNQRATSNSIDNGRAQPNKYQSIPVNRA